MIQNGMVKVVCSGCGKEFFVKVEDTTIEPLSCPACAWSINRLEIPNDGSRVIAIVKEVHR
jgi:DNA-directed RNA polymerase subunit RPC12/RpoP